MFSNARRVLSQCNTRLRLLYLLIDECEIDWVKNDIVPPSHAPNCTGRQSYFVAVISSRLIFKNMTVKCQVKEKKRQEQNLFVMKLYDFI